MEVEERTTRRLLCEQMYEKPTSIRPSESEHPELGVTSHNGTSLIFKRLMNRINTNMRKSIPVSACVSKKASRSALRNVHRFPMIFRQISPRLAYFPHCSRAQP